MNRNCYTFNYSTKTKSFKSISDMAFSFTGALCRFRKNVRFVDLFGVWRNGSKIV